MNAVSEGHYCVTLHDEEMTSLGCLGPCREDTLPRDDRSRAKEWFRGHTRICLALQVAGASDQGRYGLRGMNKYVTEVSEGNRVMLGGVDASGCTGKFVAREQKKPKTSSSSSSTTTIPFGL